MIRFHRNVSSRPPFGFRTGLDLKLLLYQTVMHFDTFFASFNASRARKTDTKGHSLIGIGCFQEQVTESIS